MIVIRTAQMNTFARHLEQRFLKDNLDIFCTMGEGATVNQNREGLLEQLQISLSVARQYGIERDADLLAFLKLTVAIAPRFDLYIPAQEILKSDTIEDDERMTVLLELMTEEDWLAACTHET